ncbi:Sensor histidine kinase TmoS [Pandoraea iniqua]|uniref:histidine kinase n=2 Tax=Pandoraea iniqua TaxID=2508288 RepID=A0A5E4XFX0_9BURK|nr:Sensor histidine kinase TmoS [Pandoraea iniqua]
MSSRLARKLRAAITLAVIASYGLVAPDASCAEPPKVVLLTGSDPMQAATLMQTQAIRAVLNDALPLGAETFLDSVDGHRFSAALLTPELFALLRKKYEGQHIDLVIAIGNYAAEFARAHHDAIWPDTPVLVTSVPDAWLKMSGAFPSTFVVIPYRIEIDKTLAIAQRLQPDATRLIVIGGSATLDQHFSDEIVDAAQASDKRWGSIERWEGLPVPELQSRLAKLDKRDSAVLYGTQYLDRDGRRYFPFEVVNKIANDAPVPIYGWYANYLIQGAAAGAVQDLEENGHMTGTIAARMLSGGTPWHPDVTGRALPARCMANVAVLKRLGISERSLGRDCKWLNAPLPPYREYWKEIAIILFVIGAQAFTIFAMLRQRRERRAAEREAATRRADLTRASRIATVGELSASIAHEVGQPLGAILSNVDAADLMMQSAGHSDTELQEILSDVRRDALRANDVVVRLRTLLQKQAITFTPVAFDAVLERATALVRPEARRRGIVLRTVFGAQDADVLADQVQLQQVLLNLSINAMDAMENAEQEDRELAISTRIADDGVELVVADRGLGIAEETVDQLFEAFYTTKERGTGLGLSIVRSIADAHRGSVFARSRTGKGTEFILWLPLAPAMPRPAYRRDPEEASA